MRKSLIWFGLVMVLLLVGCERVPDDEIQKYEKSITDEDSLNSLVKFNELSHLKNTKYEGYNVIRYNLVFDGNKKFSELSKDEKYYRLKEMIEKIVNVESNGKLECKGKKNLCMIENVAVSSDNDIYEMEVTSDKDSPLELVVNDEDGYVPEKDKEDETITNTTENSTESSSNEYEIYSYMKNLYDRLTDYGENYNPEYHDQKVDELTAKHFGITESEANRIYMKYETVN